jgi:hypothetical protein
MSSLDGRARFVYRVNRVNYFRCLECGDVQPAATIERHLARCERKPGGAPTLRSSDDHPARRDPYRDD